MILFVNPPLGRSRATSYAWYQGESTQHLSDVPFCHKKILHIINVQSEHAGYYFAQATFEDGKQIISKPAYLVVRATSYYGYVLDLDFYFPDFNFNFLFVYLILSLSLL